ncbi:hypothetical protein [Agarilytica rhodophyticola]|uniref:hypothetical protein n=1 Tax=Agarilytica rhodophyticola TaxID=1737490 RepID=UPI000B3474B9|nr:hypothetical protein [Agarilytica rhodophyticola]
MDFYQNEYNAIYVHLCTQLKLTEAYAKRVAKIAAYGIANDLSKAEIIKDLSILAITYPTDSKEYAVTLDIIRVTLED